MIAAEKTVNEARQLAVENTWICADAEWLAGSASASDPATGTRLECSRSPCEADGSTDRCEGEATSTAAGGVCDTDGNPRVRAFQRTASHARSSASRGDAVS